MIELFDPSWSLQLLRRRSARPLRRSTMFMQNSHMMFDMFDLSSLRTGIMAGSPCPIEAMKRVMNDMNMKEVTIAYGLTEASPVFTQTSVDDPIEKRVETVGTPLPHIEVKIVDPETGEELGPGEPGEICCRGYNVMKGYYKMPEMTAEAIDEDGWLHSGDLAVMDEDGYYSIVGRIKDMIIAAARTFTPGDRGIPPHHAGCKGRAGSRYTR